MVAAGVAGYVAGDASRDEAPIGATTALGELGTYGPLRLSLPAGWQVDDRSVPDGSVLSGLWPIAARPDAPNSARLLAWVSTGEVNPQLLPLGRIDPNSLAAAAAPTTVEFPNGQTALRYDNLRLRRRQSPLRVYVAPTTKGVVTLACPADYLPQPCNAVATTIAAVDADPLSVDPDAAVAEGLRGVFARLTEAVKGPTATLAGSKKGDVIAAASLELAAAYRSAGESIRGMDAPLGAASVSFDGISARMDAVASGYEAIARAAKAGDRDAYSAASARMDEAGRQLEVTLKLLRGMGYDIGTTE